MRTADFFKTNFIIFHTECQVKNQKIGIHEWTKKSWNTGTRYKNDENV